MKTHSITALSRNKLGYPVAALLLVSLGLGTALCGCGEADNVDSKIALVESGLLPPVIIKGESPYTLGERMAHYNIPGVSIAVIRDSKIDWVKHYGVRDSELGEPVTDSTLFGVGSLSKAVAAATILHLVNEEEFRLDDNVNSLLTSWKIPENELTAKSPVTVRRLLNHSGGMMPSPPFGYSDSSMPTLLQLLSGEPPAMDSPARVEREPGTSFLYSNIGYSILQLLVEDVTGLPYKDYVEQVILTPLDMHHSTVANPLPPAKEAYASAAHKPDGSCYEIKRLAYPILAAGGLWTTATEYAKFVIELQRSLRGESNLIMSRELAQQMVSPHEAKEYGLGVFMRYRDDVTYFGHIGDLRGFCAGFVSHPHDGSGVVVVTNSNNSIHFIREITKSVAKAYGWESYLPREFAPVALSPETAKASVGRYRVGFDEVVALSLQDGTMFIETADGEQARLYPIGGDTLVRKDREGQMVLVRDSQGQVLSANYHFADDIGRMTGDGVDAPRMAEGDMIPLEVLLSGNEKQAEEMYRAYRQSHPEDPAIAENHFNNLGYQFLNQGDLDAALAIFGLNIALYPESGNCYDSMGEALLSRGDSTAALEHYLTALKLNPGNSNAARIVEALSP